MALPATPAVPTDQLLGEPSAVANEWITPPDSAVVPTLNIEYVLELIIDPSIYSFFSAPDGVSVLNPESLVYVKVSFGFRIVLIFSYTVEVIFSERLRYLLLFQYF